MRRNGFGTAIAVVGVVMGAVMGGCYRHEAPPAVDDSDRLYHGIIKLAEDYLDSIANAPDSASAAMAFERFNAKLDSLNFAVAPDTDLLLTEAENDTVFQAIMRVRVAKEEVESDEERGTRDEEVERDEESWREGLREGKRQDDRDDK